MTKWVTWMVLVVTAGCGSGGGGCRDHVDSPHGSVPFGTAAGARDGRALAREIEPARSGMIGVFDRATGTRTASFDAWAPASPNDLKGLAWHPSSRVLAVMFHATRVDAVSGDSGAVSFVSFWNVGLGAKVAKRALDGFYHGMRFVDGTRLRLTARDRPGLTVPVEVEDVC